MRFSLSLPLYLPPNADVGSPETLPVSVELDDDEPDSPENTASVMEKDDSPDALDKRLEVKRDPELADHIR